MTALEYLRDPDTIYARSFELIRAETDMSRLPATARPIAERIVHACAMPEVATALRITDDFVAKAKAALKSGTAILTDAEMVKSGIIASRLPAGVRLYCHLNDPAAREISIREKTTRSAAAVDLWMPHLHGAVVVIGNAPTALFALLEHLDAGAPRPAAIIALPVGFVGAAEAKEELLRDPRGIPYLTLPGRRGGSAMAAAALNALLIEASS
ncbi:MAG: precorrin-8X methylmutase [Hyphomicrobiales bacterium]